jgi:hypothetical protein
VVEPSEERLKQAGKLVSEWLGDSQPPFLVERVALALEEAARTAQPTLVQEIANLNIIHDRQLRAAESALAEEKAKIKVLETKLARVQQEAPEIPPDGMGQ